MLLVAAAALWMVVLVGAPRAASGQPSRWLAVPVFGVYAIGSVICHQRPERSFALWRTPMPVCARCAGIYLGAFVAAVALFVRRPAMPPAASAMRWSLSVALVPGLATLLYEWVTHEAPSNLSRAASGLPLGFAILWVIGSLLGTRSVQTSYTSGP